MRGSCRICNSHPQRAAIDARLTLGVTLRTIAREFGIPLSTLGRHAQHSRTATERAAIKIGAAYARSLHSCLRAAQAEVMMILKSARLSGDGALALQASGELRRLVETGRKLLAKAAEHKPEKRHDDELAPEVVERILQTRKAENERQLN